MQALGSSRRRNVGSRSARLFKSSNTSNDTSKKSIIPPKSGISVSGADDLVHRSWKYMYRMPPTGDITLEEFELYAYERLQLLTKIDMWKAKGLRYNELNQAILEESHRLFGDADTSTKDWISHHILRLAYSQDEALRRWFISTESALFEARLVSESDSQYLAILENNELEMERLAGEEYEEMKDDLKKIAFGIIEHQSWQVNRQPPPALESNEYLKLFGRLKWFKVDFIHVLNLVRNRKVLIRGGKAYVTTKNLTTMIMQNYRAVLSASLAYIQRVWPFIRETEKDRLLPLLTRFSERSVTIKSEYSAHLNTLKDRRVTLDQIDQLCSQSFPLCMKNLHSNLKKNRHLKHLGRMQYGLFLKGIGLSLDDALRFWSTHFSLISHDQFQKDYSYNIRHNYGKEGKRTNYSPYGCMKIIMGAAPGANEHHGCPFRHFDENKLRATMTRESGGRVNSMQVSEVISLVKKQHYELACRKYFDLTHPEMPKEMKDQDDDTPFQHPNLYYDTSRKIIEEGNVQSSTTPQSTDKTPVPMEEEE